MASSKRFLDSSITSWFNETDLLSFDSKPPMHLFEDNLIDTNIEIDDMKLDIEDILLPCNIMVDDKDVDQYKKESPIISSMELDSQTNVFKLESLFTNRNTRKRRKQELDIKSDTKRLQNLSYYEEKELFLCLDALSKLQPLNHEMNRLRRKLVARRLKLEHGLPVFDIDAEMRFLRTNGHLASKQEKKFMRMTKEDIGSRILDRFQIVTTAADVSTEHYETFTSKLVGSGHCHRPIYSPYSLRTLRPIILQDFDVFPIKLCLLQDIVAYPYRNEDSWKPPPKHPIQYCYVTPKHVPAMNMLARQFFWPGIELSEVLQYPDHTCVVLYKCLVIGFGILVPDTNFNEAYISFLLVHPEWRRSGIAKFILYHLIQTCPGKDITLHVSATNPALLLYQSFGFKVEEFLTNFYDKYLPFDSSECKHALYMRLSG